MSIIKTSMKSVVCTKTNPAMLTWARESLDISAEKSAKRLSITESAYKKLEDSSVSPTLAQLRKLALLYRRPVAVFFLPTPPKDTRRPKDFRSHKDELSHKTLLSIRRARSIQKYYKLLTEVSRPAFWIKSDSPKDDAQNARTWIDLSVERQVGFKDSQALFNYLVEQLQKKHIQVVLHSYPKTDAKAYCFPEAPSMIVISTNDEFVESRLFSLFHELCHLSAGDSGLCLVQESYHQHTKERFCDRFATNALMPEGLVRSLVGAKTADELLDSDVMNSIASTIKCSKLALLYRFQELGFISASNVASKKAEWAKYLLRTKRFGKPNRIAKTLRENGIPFTSAVIDAYFNNRISTSDASRMLGVNQAYIEQVGDMVGQR